MTAHDERSLVLLSALTQTSLRLEASPPLSLSAKGEKVKPDVVLRDVMRGRTTPNRALIDARAEPAPQEGSRAWHFTFTVRNSRPRRSATSSCAWPAMWKLGRRAPAHALAKRR
jgi:hypothetical protein